MRRSALRAARTLTGGGLLAATSLAFALYAAGVWDPLPITPAPESAFEAAPGKPVEDASGLGIGRASGGFRIEQLSGTAGVTTFVAWRATGKSFVPLEAPARGYAIAEPRLWIAGRLAPGDETEVVAPLGTLSSLTAPGEVRAELSGAGGVHLVHPRATIDAAQLDVVVPAPTRAEAPTAANPFARLQRGRVLRARIGSVAPVDARFAIASDAGPVGSGTIAAHAEGGFEADADLEQVLLHGPVRARDDAGRIALDAREHVALSFARSPAGFMGWLDGPGASIGGVEPLVPAFGTRRSSWVLRRLEASGAVDLVFRSPPRAPGRAPIDLHIAGDFVVADLGRGVLVVTGTPGVVEQRGAGESVRASVVVLRDRGEGRIEFSALGDAALTTALRKTTRGEVPRVWSVAGEEAMGTLAKAPESERHRKKKALAAKPGPRPLVRRRKTSAHGPTREALELVPVDAIVWPRPEARGSISSGDGRVAGAFDLATLERERGADGNGDLVVGERDTIRASGGGRPAEVWTEESRVGALELAFDQARGEPGRVAPVHVRLDTGAHARLGHDVVLMVSETRQDADAPGSTGGSSPTGALASGGPWDVAGDSVALDVWPKAVDKDRDLAWWERSSLLGARVTGAARVRGAAPSGAPVAVAGRALALDLVKGKLSLASEPGERAHAAVGGSFVDARRIDGDLRAGRIDARGDVRARRELAPDALGKARSVTLEAARARATIEPDEARLADERRERSRDRRLGRSEVGPPPELLAASAEGDARTRAVVRTEDGLAVDADALEWDAARGTGFARVREGAAPVHLAAPLLGALARDVDASAREAELSVAREGPALARYRLELTGDVRARGKAPERADRLKLVADRARAVATLGGELARPHVTWGPVLAWSASERPVVVSSDEDGPAAVPELEARGRTLRLFPDTRTAVFEGAPDEPIWLARGRGLVRALRADPASIESASAVVSERGERPFALRAPEATLVLDRDAEGVDRPRAKRSRDREERTAAEERLAEAALRALHSMHVPGPIVARADDRTIHASSLEYDGSTHCATLRGDPVRIADGKGRVQLTKRFVYRLDDEDVKER